MRGLSLGSEYRLQVAKSTAGALIHNPKLFLFAPTRRNVDRNSRNLFLCLILRLAGIHEALFGHFLHSFRWLLHFTFIIPEIERNKTRTRSVIQKMSPNCLAVITVLEVGLNLVDKIVL